MLMTTEAIWLTMIYTPGFSPVRHRCTVEIYLGGRLRQQLAECSAGEWLAIAPEYEAQLDGTKMNMLRDLLASIDFERLRARLSPARGASVLAIEWHPLDAISQRVEGRILSYDRGYHDFRQTFEPAQRLWKLVCELLPHPFMKQV